MNRSILFSPPDITQAEIDAVMDVLQSGWITTGKKTKEFEAQLASFIGVERVACLSSNTAALECGLRLLGVGEGDEVITSAYTYTASAAAICHVGATPVLCDVAPDSYEMDYESLSRLITPRTRAVIPVDIAGRMINYDALFAVLEEAASVWQARTPQQAAFSRIPVLADAAHSLGARRNNKNSGQVADLTAFSFHAVKNLTTSEGGALTWRPDVFDDEEAYRQVMLMSLHGQTKDALSKSSAGSWEYDIVFPGWKCNMTDIQAALGLAQLSRYSNLLVRRREIVKRYESDLSSAPVEILQHFQDDASVAGFASSAHLMMVRLSGHDAAFRNDVIQKMAQAGVATNVHYKPLPLLTAYQKLGFKPEDYPCAIAQFENEITLPLHTLLSDSDVDYVSEKLCSALASKEK